jgi:hypothetical protein
VRRRGSQAAGAEPVKGLLAVTSVKIPQPQPQPQPPSRIPGDGDQCFRSIVIMRSTDVLCWSGDRRILTDPGKTTRVLNIMRADEY